MRSPRILIQLITCISDAVVAHTQLCSKGSCAGARAVHDHAYRWPMFMPISAPVDYGPEDLAVFTLSKLTGAILSSRQRPARASACWRGTNRLA